MKKILLMCLLPLISFAATDPMIFKSEAIFKLPVMVGINSVASTVDGSAILELYTTSKGLLLPRLTTTQRNAIVNPTYGLAIYNSTTNTIDYYKPTTGWQSLADSGTTQATQALDNLAAVAINTALLPGSTNSIDLGSPSKVWQELHAMDLELYGNSSGILTIKPPASVTDYTLTFPASNGIAGQVMQATVSGVLSWASVSTKSITTIANNTSLTPAQFDGVTLMNASASSVAATLPPANEVSGQFGSFICTDQTNPCSIIGSISGVGVYSFPNTNAAVTVFSNGNTYNFSDNTNYSVISPDSVGTRLASAYIYNASGTPVVDSQDGSWITSLYDGGTGIVGITYTASTFTGRPRCMCHTTAAGGSRPCIITSINPGSIGVYTVDMSSSPENDSFTIMCVGDK